MPGGYQPYGARGGRRRTAALDAMQRGRGPLLHAGAGEVRRRAMKRKRTRKPRARYRSPLAKVLAVRRNVQRP